MSRRSRSTFTQPVDSVHVGIDQRVVTWYLCIIHVLTASTVNDQGPAPSPGVDNHLHPDAMLIFVFTYRKSEHSTVFTPSFNSPSHPTRPRQFVDQLSYKAMQMSVTSTSLQTRALLRFWPRIRLYCVHTRPHAGGNMLPLAFTRTLSPINSISRGQHQAACNKHRENNNAKSAGHVDDFRRPSFWQDTPTWKRASINTLHCLFGCSIGDFGTLYLCASYYPSLPMYVAMPIAMAAGICTSTLVETLRMKYTVANLSWKQCLTTAMNMSLISMLVMEMAENVTDILLMGISVPADAGTSITMLSTLNTHSPQFLLSLSVSLFAGFIAPLPYNYYVVKKYGRGCH